MCAPESWTVNIYQLKNAVFTILRVISKNARMSGNVKKSALGSASFSMINANKRKIALLFYHTIVRIITNKSTFRAWKDSFA